MVCVYFFLNFLCWNWSNIRVTSAALAGYGSTVVIIIVRFAFNLFVSFFARPVTDKVRVPVNHKLAWLPAITIVEFFEALLKFVIAALDEVLLVI